MTDITRYARERWEWGARNEDDVAIAYIRLALGQRDPENTLDMLLAPVRAAVSEVFRVERQRTEDRVPWDDLLSHAGTETIDDTTEPHAPAETNDGTARPNQATETRRHTGSTWGRTYLGADHAPSTLAKIQELMKTSVWVWRTKEDGKQDGRMIPWSELRIDDIEPTIARERDVILGHERRIYRLQKAQQLMEQHNVTVFGEIPFSAEVEELVNA